MAERKTFDGKKANYQTGTSNSPHSGTATNSLERGGYKYIGSDNSDSAGAGRGSGDNPEARKKKNEDAANGKYRLTTDDKKY